MCLAIPAKILSIEGDLATVDLEGTHLRVNLSLVEGAAPGRHVLVHAGFALELLSEEDVKELAFYHERMRELAAGDQP